MFWHLTRVQKQKMGKIEKNTHRWEISRIEGKDLRVDHHEGRSLLFSEVLSSRRQDRTLRAMREAPGQSGCRVSESKMWARASRVSMWRNRQGGWAGLGLASLNNFSRSWSKKAVPSCLLLAALWNSSAAFLLLLGGPGAKSPRNSWLLWKHFSSLYPW